MSGPTIPETIAYVRLLFAGVSDKGGHPYAEHCIRVAHRLPAWVGVDAQHAALLHDVIEDTHVTGSDLSALGYSERTVWLAEKLSRRREDGTYMEWIRSIAETGDAELIAIKLSDNADNSDPARIVALPPEQRDIVKRYDRARRVLSTALTRSAPTPERTAMSEMTMIERVARAIARAQTFDPDKSVAQHCFDEEGAPHESEAPAWTLYLAEARAAIEAMRDPDIEMLVAGQEAWMCYAAAEERGEANWRAMIDAALAEPAQKEG